MTANSLNTFKAPAGTTLAANTTYWVTIGEGITSFKVQVWTTDGNDEAGEPGWTIGNRGLWRIEETDSWSSDAFPLLITIKGTISTDATLSGLVLEGADGGETITLSPAFAANQYTYRAAVVNNVDEITIAPTVNHSNAEYEIEDGGGNALTDADLNETGFQVALSEGTNTLTVDGDGAERRHANLHGHRGTAYRRHLGQQHASRLDRL